MNQERNEEQVDPITAAAPGETPIADRPKGVIVGPGGLGGDQVAWSFEAEQILREVPAKPGDVWKDHEPTGYAVYKIRLFNRQPGGETLELLVLTLSGNKLREALLALHDLASGGELFDELYTRQKDSGNLPPDKEPEEPEQAKE